MEKQDIPQDMLKSNFWKNRATDENGEIVKSDNTEGNFSFCLVIPFGKKSDLIKAKDRIIESRGNGEKWFMDEVIIPEDDFTKIISKSNKIKILFSLDKKDEKEEVD